MYLQKKALYNLIQLNLKQTEEVKINLNKLKSWQIENYRTLPTPELLHRLHDLNISLDTTDFETCAQSFENPEDMSEFLTKGMDDDLQDQVFLIVFELWRRLIFEKRSLSIFCDELDYQIMAYDLGKSESPTDIQDALAYLQQILEEYADEGEDPKQIFRTIQTFCANDLEDFLFDYILEQIETDNYSYSSELLEGFSPFMLDPIWFEYLRARIYMIHDPEEGFEGLERIISELETLDIAFEMLSFLAETGNHTLFYSLTRKIEPLLESEEDFIEFAEICLSHYQYLEIETNAKIIKSIIEKRKFQNVDSDHPISQHDPDLLQLQTILKQKLQFAIEG